MEVGELGAVEIEIEERLEEVGEVKAEERGEVAGEVMTDERGEEKGEYLRSRPSASSSPVESLESSASCGARRRSSRRTVAARST